MTLRTSSPCSRESPNSKQDWPKEVWATQLAGLLTGKGLAAYAAMVSTEALDYERVKKVGHNFERNGSHIKVGITEHNGCV